MSRVWIGRILGALLALCLLCAGPVAGALAEAEEPADAAAAEFTPEEQEHNRSLGVLRVGYVQNRVPVTFTDEQTGELGGISRAIFDRIQEISGLQFEYVELPLGSVTYDYLLGEKLDLITSVEYNEENKHARGILMSEPYLRSQKVVVGHANYSFDRYSHLKVAISTGSQTIKKVMNNYFPNFEFVDCETTEDCFEAIRRGDADILIQNQYVVEHYLYKPQYERLAIIPVIGMADELCFSAVTPLEPTAEEAARGQELIDTLDRAISLLTEDEIAGFIIESTLSNQYKYSFEDFVYSYRYTLIALGIAAVVIIALIILSVRLYLRSAAARAESRAKSDFLSFMSHEIRTPLHGLIGLNYLMEQNLDDKGKLQAYLKQSSTTAKYLQSLLNDILDMSKLAMEKMELFEHPFSLREALNMIEAIEGGRLREKGVEFSMDAQLAQPAIVGDPVRLEQVLLNIIDNAYKFTPAGGSVTLTVQQEEAAGGRVNTRVEITDTGCGMSEEFQKQIFNSFTQERSTVSKGNQGTGLGMAISYQIAKLMGGDLKVESALGKGSKFTLTFPAQIADALPEKESADEGGTLGGRILVAEDNELNAQILMELLQEEGFDADLARDGQEAIDLFIASTPGSYRYVLMDLLMPVKDGCDAAREIRRLPRPDAKKVKIFACTANSTREERERAIASGMDDFITKPVDIEKLLRMLRG